MNKNFLGNRNTNTFIKKFTRIIKKWNSFVQVSFVTRQMTLVRKKIWHKWIFYDLNLLCEIWDNSKNCSEVIKELK